MPTYAPAPTRQTSEASLDQWNQALRVSPLWQNFMRERGYLDPDGAVRRNLRLSESDRRQLEYALQSQGVQLPPGMKIDESGNFNQKNTLGRNLAIGAGITAATLATMGAAGVFSGAGAAAGTGVGGGVGYGLTPALIAENAALGIGAGAGAGVGAGTIGGLAGVGGGVKKVADVVSNTKGAGLSYPLSTLLSTLVGGGMQLWGANQQIGASDRGAQLQADAAQRALDFAKEQDSRNYQDYLKERERAWGTSDRDYQDFLNERERTRAREDADRTRTWGLEDARTARLEPFRARGAYAYNKLADLLK